jgi:hypothetical protein
MVEFHIISSIGSSSALRGIVCVVDTIRFFLNQFGPIQQLEFQVQREWTGISVGANSFTHSKTLTAAMSAMRNNAETG